MGLDSGAREEARADGDFKEGARQEMHFIVWSEASEGAAGEDRLRGGTGERESLQGSRGSNGASAALLHGEEGRPRPLEEVRGEGEIPATTYEARGIRKGHQSIGRDSGGV